MSIRKSLFKFYWFVQRRIAPGLKYSQYLYEDVLKSCVHDQMVWLDMGCGHQLLPAWRAAEEKQLIGQCKQIVGIDYDLPSLVNHRNISSKVRGDLRKLPFQDGYFDLVTANMVAEHLEDPQQVFEEVKRVLKPGGVFIFHTPNARGYVTVINRMVPPALKDSLVKLLDGRDENDVFETHYRVNQPQEIDHFAQLAGFKVVKIKLLVTSAVFAVVPPLAIFELVWIRLLMTKLLKPFRTNIIAVLEKQPS